MNQAEKSLYIDGRWSQGSAEAFPVINPATEELIAHVPSADEREVANALESARVAQPGWARRPAIERGDYLRRIADVMLANVEPLASLLVEEVGKPLALARREITRTAEYVRFTAAWDRRIEGEILPSDNRDEAVHLLRAPLGVVAAICAWNYPISLYFRKLAPALVTGNTVVLKPSEVTPLTSLAMTRLIDGEVGLPDGVLNFVTGGADTGRALVRGDADMISFTGHRDTGKAIMADAASRLTRVSLELGGKAPAIVTADADLEIAVQATIRARHTNSGQVCTCAERVFVEETVFEAFVARYVEMAGALRLGDPRGDVDMGPLVNRIQFDKSERAIEAATDEGAELVLTGGRPQGASFERGFWFSPAVLTGVTPRMSVMREETFGPVTPIMPVGSIEEAIELANDSRYGLSAYLFTRSYETVLRATHDVRFGELFINRALGEAMQAHHAGHRESGIGGEDGKHGVLAYTQLRAVYHNATDPFVQQ